MANLTAKIELNTSTVAAEIFNFSLTNQFSVKNPVVQTATADIAHDADTSVVTPAAGSAAYVWVYNKDATNYIKIKLAGTELLRVGPGEANLICVDSSRACALRADTATCKCEYGYFTLDKY